MTTTPALLIVEDDAAMAAGLRDNFEIEQFRVMTAASLAQARALLKGQSPDVALIDVMLPDGEGISLCREMRQHGFTGGVILLTALGQELDRVRGLEMGADDYVVKPFSLRELIARVHAQVRRLRGYSKGNIDQHVIGIAIVDFKRHRLVRNNEVIEVSAKEMDLLAYFCVHRGEVISRDRLLTDVWGHQRDVATRTVDNFIVRLRRKIEPDPERPQFLLTIHGSGYKLIEQ